LLGLFAIVMGVMPLMTGRFPTRQESSERITILLWLLPLVFAVEMCTAAVWYSHEYDRRWKKGKHVACSLEDSQNEIAGNLRRLTTEGLEGSFMIVARTLRFYRELCFER